MIFSAFLLLIILDVVSSAHLYHRTTRENYDNITKSGRLIGYNMDVGIPVTWVQARLENEPRPCCTRFGVENIDLTRNSVALGVRIDLARPGWFLVKMTKKHDFNSIHTFKNFLLVYGRDRLRQLAWEDIVPVNEGMIAPKWRSDEDVSFDDFLKGQVSGTEHVHIAIDQKYLNDAFETYSNTLFQQSLKILVPKKLDRLDDLTKELGQLAIN